MDTHVEKQKLDAHLTLYIRSHFRGTRILNVEGRNELLENMRGYLYDLAGQKKTLYKQNIYNRNT